MRFQLILACELPPPNITPSPAAHNAEWHDFIHAIPGGDWFLLALSMIPAIYTGLVASRAFAFYQARYRAVNWAYAMDGIIHRRDLSPNQFFISLSHSIMPLMLEFRALGHEAFVTALADCAKRYFSQVGQLVKVEFDPKFTPTFPDGGTPEDKAAFMVSMLKFHNDAMTGHVPEFAAIRPSYLAIFNPIPFPNYLTFNGKHIGLFVKKASWPKLIYLRLLLVLKPNRKKSTQNDVGS